MHLDSFRESIGRRGGAGQASGGFVKVWVLVWCGSAAWAMTSTLNKGPLFSCIVHFLSGYPEGLMGDGEVLLMGVAEIGAWIVTAAFCLG